MSSIEELTIKGEKATSGVAFYATGVICALVILFALAMSL